ncbi:MAG: hypothetical protein AAFQ80_07915 [Cyanobacteria bacterium J06621_8]
MIKFLTTSLLAVGILTSYQSFEATASEVPIKYDEVSATDALQGMIPVSLHPGKATSIDFSEVGEYVTFILPSDKSRFLYTTDLPIESGESQSVHLVPIKKIDFEGTYQTSRPNLIVRTINSQGESKQYNLLLSFSSEIMTSAGIKIVPTVQQLNPQLIRVSFNQTVDADGVEEGLKLAIKEKYVLGNDPVVNQVRNFVFRLRNGSSLEQAITASQINPSILESLGELYLENRLLERFGIGSASNPDKVPERMER